MQQKVTATELRRNIYKLLDEVLQSKVPLEVKRKGKRLIIIPADACSKFDRLDPHVDCVKGDLEDLVHMDWSKEWLPEL
jgi:hypothetical protein